MQTFSATLTTAQQSPERDPTVSLVIEDLIPRYAVLHGADTESTAQTAMLKTAAGSIVRAKLTDGGVVYWQRITTPATAGQWTNWTQLSTLGTSSSHHADISICQNSGGDIRIIWLYATGGNSYLKFADSSDDGASWGAVATGLTLAGEQLPHALAAGGKDDVFLVRYDGELYYYEEAGGTYTETSEWTGTVMTQCYGIAIVQKTLYSYPYLIVLAYQRNDVPHVSTLDYFEPSGIPTWSSEVYISPPGRSPDHGFWWGHPSLAWDGTDFRLAMTDERTGSPYASQVAIFRGHDDFDKWSIETGISIDTPAQNPHRANVIHLSDRWYIASDVTVVESEDYDASDTKFKVTIPNDRVHAYRLAERWYEGWAVVDLDNTDGAFNAYGEGGDDYEALKLLSRVTIKRGFVVDGADHTADHSPMHILGVNRYRHLGQNKIRLILGDAFDVMKLARPHSIWAYDSQTIEDLITWLLWTVGGYTPAFSGSSEWTDTSINFSIQPDMPLWMEFKRLLRKVGAACRWKPDGDLYLWIPADESPSSDYSYGGAHPIYEAEYIQQPANPTHTRLYGGAVGSSEDSSVEMALGRRISQTLVDRSLTSVARANFSAVGMEAFGGMKAREGHITVPINVGQELGDFVDITDSEIDYSEELRRVVEIREEYEVRKWKVVFRGRYGLSGV